MCRIEMDTYERCPHSSKKREIPCAPARNVKSSGGLFGCFGRQKMGSRVCKMGKASNNRYHRDVACPRCQPSAYSRSEIQSFVPSEFDRFDRPSVAQNYLQRGPARQSRPAPKSAPKPIVAKPQPAVVKNTGKAQRVAYGSAPRVTSVKPTVHMASPASSSSRSRRAAQPRQTVQQRAPSSSRGGSRHPGKQPASSPRSHHSSSSRSGGSSSRSHHPSPRPLGPASSSEAQPSPAPSARQLRGPPQAHKNGPQKRTAQGHHNAGPSASSSQSPSKTVRGSVYDPEVAMLSHALPGFYGQGATREQNEDRFQPRDLHIPTYERDGHGAFYTDLQGRQVYTGPPSPTSTCGGEDWRSYSQHLSQAEQFGLSNNIYRGSGFQY
ncbi:hypothetical protein MKZ38_002497 [Zalerion maritima]|uniref:Uncharacterized protein n=1 Tax=Zalerion maritima TaxID=339359 RepID=A0AAD5RQD5_9PEZI|nr:hypothetical protein MKZ38_002497 [Zalerion maritima]